MKNSGAANQIITSFENMTGETMTEKQTALKEAKRILILGAAADQVSLIVKSKELGYHVIVCDRTTTNPGLKYADKHYQIDYMDRDAVMEVAEKEHIDGIISNSEPAMVNVACISEALSLRGNTPDSVRSLGEKNLFRKLQAKAGVYAPKQADVRSAGEAELAIKEMTLPVLIKPCRCSASRGVTKIDACDRHLIEEAFSKAAEQSWNGEVSVEEFVDMPSMTVIEGDIFVYDGKILWDGLFNDLRSRHAPMVPMIDISPLVLPEEQYAAMQDTVSRIVKTSGIKFGAFNIEMYFTSGNELFVIEINTRQGGIGVPKFIEQYTGLDYSKLLVSLSVDDYSYCNSLDLCRFPVLKNIARLSVFGRKNGIFEDLHIPDELRHYVTDVELCLNKGEHVASCENGTDAIARVDLCFDSYETMSRYVFSIEDYIYPIIS